MEPGQEVESDGYKVELLSDEYAQYDLSFKIIFIGDSGVGKSCLTSKAAKNSFEEYYQATVGFEFLTFNLRLDNTVIKLPIWDTCGQEISRSLITNFYRNSSLAVMVYAIDNEQSFINTESWLKELKDQSNPDIRIFLVGNKSDLEESRQVRTERAEQFKDANKLDMFFETSAKTGFNAKNVLIEAAKILYTDYLKYRESAKGNDSNKDDDNKTTLRREKFDTTDNGEVRKKRCCK